MATYGGGEPVTPLYVTEHDGALAQPADFRSLQAEAVGRYGGITLRRAYRNAPASRYQQSAP